MTDLEKIDPEILQAALKKILLTILEGNIKETEKIKLEVEIPSILVSGITDLANALGTDPETVLAELAKKGIMNTLGTKSNSVPIEKKPSLKDLPFNLDEQLTKPFKGIEELTGEINKIKDMMNELKQFLPDERADKEDSL